MTLLAVFEVNTQGYCSTPTAAVLCSECGHCSGGCRCAAGMQWLPAVARHRVIVCRAGGRGRGLHSSVPPEGRTSARGRSRSRSRAPLCQPRTPAPRCLMTSITAVPHCLIIVLVVMTSPFPCECGVGRRVAVPPLSTRQPAAAAETAERGGAVRGQQHYSQPAGIQTGS